MHVFVPLEDTARMEDVAAATRAIAARAERLDPVLATTAFVREDRHGKVFLDSTRAGGATVVCRLQSAHPSRRARVLPGGLGRIGVRDAGRLHRAHRARSAWRAATSWADRMPAPQPLPADLVAEGHEIPIARVQAMHEGKRRARAARAEDGDAAR